MANFHYLPANPMCGRFQLKVHKKGGVNAAIKHARKNEDPEVGDVIISFHRMFKAGEKLHRECNMRDGVVAIAVKMPQDETHPLWGKEDVIWEKVLPTWKEETPTEIELNLLEDDPYYE